MLTGGLSDRGHFEPKGSKSYLNLQAADVAAAVSLVSSITAILAVVTISTQLVWLFYSSNFDCFGVLLFTLFVCVFVLLQPKSV